MTRPTSKNKLAPVCSQHAEAALVAQEPTQTTKEEPMVMQFEELTEEAQEHFGLERTPFLDDVLCDDDFFQTANIRKLKAALHDCAVNQRFMALVGESGAGKTTLVEDLEESFRGHSAHQVVFIRPHMLATEESDAKGKTLKSQHLSGAIARALGVTKGLPSEQDARFDAVLQLLRQSAATGRKHLMVLEEAHCLPLATIKHLKRWREEGKAGRGQSLLGILLVGQSELRARMSVSNKDVREVGARCEMKELHPFVQSSEVQAYLELKVRRVGADPAQVFAPDAFAAALARLQVMVKVSEGKKVIEIPKSICYPLALNNLASRALSHAARLHLPVVNANIFAGC
ncbi:MAG: AAA family ATPase [Burkholderiaceae bacterium]|nr:AAA family ATPase [Burkholderiaceae bacterium]